MYEEKGELVLVTGAGGFIGGHLVGDLLAAGFRRVRAVDKAGNVGPFSDWLEFTMPFI